MLKRKELSVRLFQGKSEILTNTSIQVTKFDLPGGLQGNEDKTTMYCLEHEMDITQSE